MVRKPLLVTVFICAVSAVSPALEQGTVECWGRNNHNQSTPPDGNNFISVDAGDYHSIALKSDGSLVAWGGNINDQEPPNNITNQVADTPTGSNFIAVTAGQYHNVAIEDNDGDGRGSLVCWGEDYYGQSTPPAGSDFIAVAAGYAHSIALRSDGTLAAWGVDHGNPYDYDYGQVTGTPTDSNFIAVAAGDNHNLAIAADEAATAGTIRAWGHNIFGQATPPMGNDFVAVAAGAFHSLALRSDGTLKAWGINTGITLSGDYGQVTDTPVDNGYIAIAAGGFHNIALKADGSLVAWGRDDHDEVTDTPLDTYFIAIAAGRLHSLAVKLNCPCELPDDLNADCRINLRDFQMLADGWELGYYILDLQSMAENWLVDCL